MKRTYSAADKGNKSRKCQAVSFFQVQPKSLFTGPFPPFREPTELGAFSQDDVRDFKHDRSQLRFLHWPEGTNASFNIWEGYDTFIKRDESKNEYIDNLLRWISENQKKFELPSAASNQNWHSLHTDFVCWRGLLTKLLCTPYERREGWKLACLLFNNTYYMCEFDTDEKIQQKTSQTETQKVMTYGGYKFEQYLCKGTEDGIPDTSTPINNKEAFCSVVRSRLKSHSLVYGAEVDCCEIENGKLQYVELKTSREIYHQRQDDNFKRFKLLKWWAQSFLIGIPKIVCGFRTDDGIVERLHAYRTQEIPKMCEHVNNCWEASVCFNFVNKFLDYIKKVVTEDNKRVAYVFEYVPGQNIHYSKQEPDSMYSFLPDWYCDAPVSATCSSGESSS